MIGLRRAGIVGGLILESLFRSGDKFRCFVEYPICGDRDFI